jgi:hypothetical protein
LFSHPTSHGEPQTSHPLPLTSSRCRTKLKIDTAECTELYV